MAEKLEADERIVSMANRLGEALEEVEGFAKRLKSVSALDSLHGSRGAGSLSFFTGHTHDVTANVYKSATGADSIRYRQLRSAHELKAMGYENRFKSASDYFAMMANEPAKWQKVYNESAAQLEKHLGEDRFKSLGMNTLNAESAGSLVLPEISTQILERMYSNDLWSRCDVYTVAGNSMQFPASGRSSRKDGKRNGGVLGYWTGEGMPAQVSSGKFEKVSLRLHDMCVAVFVTKDLLDDASMSLEQWISRKVAEEMNFQRGYAIMRGDGADKPLGVLQAPGTLSIPSVVDQGKTVNTRNILDMWGRRVRSDDASTQNLVWLANPEVETTLPLMTVGVGTGGELTYMPPGGLSGSPYATLMGRPVIPSEFCSALGDRGDIMLADFSQYLGIEKGGVIEEMSAHVQFLRREMCFLFTIRWDGRPIDDKTIEPLFGTKHQSPFVVIEDRADA